MSDCFSWRFLLVLTPWLFLTSSSAAQWTKQKSLPDAEGFAGMFAGVSHDVLLVAGGANFPDTKPWNGGVKKWYDTVCALTKPDGEWKAVGQLPRPLAYGVSVTHGNCLVCVGGSDAMQHYPDVFRLEWEAGRLRVHTAAALPKPLANACGALVGNTLFIAGGSDKPDASEAANTVYSLDLSIPNATWVERKPWPGRPRMLAIAGAFNEHFYLMGGVELVANKSGKVERQYLKDAFVFAERTGWKPLPDLPHPLAASASPAPVDARGIYILGGDTGEHVQVSHDKHPGFSKTILHLDNAKQVWQSVGELPAPRVTLPCAYWQKFWFLPSGERKPGVRSPEVWSFAVPTK